MARLGRLKDGMVVVVDELCSDRGVILKASREALLSSDRGVIPAVVSCSSMPAVYLNTGNQDPENEAAAMPVNDRSRKKRKYEMVQSAHLTTV